MEVVAAGPAVGLAGQSSVASQAYVSNSVVVYLQGETERKEKNKRGDPELGTGFYLGTPEEGSESSSSIGEPEESSVSSTTEERNGEDEVQSKPKGSPLGSLDALEESLPIKRGLSNFFSGKSKSFACLSDVANGNAKDLGKHENPFNKRRRILMASKNSLSRRASYSSFNISLPPLNSSSFTVEEDDDEEEEEEEDDEGNERRAGSLSSLPPLPNRVTKLKAFSSPRSFSLSDLQHA